MIEYYKNTNLADIVYYCEIDFLWKTEQWKDIVGYEGLYKISDLGRAKSLRRYTSSGNLLKERIMVTYFDGKGNYLCLKLSKNGIKKSFGVHQLVAICFLEHTTVNRKVVINHKNLIKTHNTLSNLEIVSQRENINHRYLHDNTKTSKFRGVHLQHGSTVKWLAVVIHNKKQIRLGCFDLEKEASEYYEKALIAIEKGEEIQIKKPEFYSQCRGITFDKNINRWIAQKTVNGVKKYIGCFIQEEDACAAYQQYIENIKNTSISNQT